MTLRPELYFEDELHIAAVFGKKDLSSLPDTSDEESQRRIEKTFLAQQFNLSEERVFFLRQVHGTDSYETVAPDNALYVGEGDALFTSIPRMVLCIRTADCLPIFFTARHKTNRLSNCVGLIHAGWRGLADGIIERTLNRVADHYFHGSADLQWNLRIGPGIGFQSYEVGPEVAGRFRETRPGAGDRSYLDLVSGAKNRINQNPTPGKYQFDNEFEGCTFVNNDRFYSHRKGDTGRNLNIIMLK